MVACREIGMKRAVVTLLSVATLLGAATVAAASSSPQLTQIGRLPFPERGYVVDLPEGAVASPDAFRVWENNRRVKNVDVAALGDAGIRSGVVLAIDTSESMAGKPLRQAFAAARSFVAHRAKGQQIAVVTFDGRVRVLVPPTSSAERLERALSRPTAVSYGTHIYDAVDGSLAVLARAKLGTGAVILLSDGADVGSVAPLSKVLETSRSRDVRIFTVGLRSGAFEPGALRRLAVETAGSYAEAPSASSLSSVYDALGRRLAGEYVVRYRSDAAPSADVGVRVDVEGVGTATTSYTAPTPALLAPFHRSLVSRFVLAPAAAALLSMFVAALVALAMLLVLRPRRTSIVDRVEQFAAAAEPGAPETPERLPASPRVSRLEPQSWLGRLEQQLAIARIEMSARTVVLLTVGATIVAIVVCAMIGPVFAVLALFTPLVTRAIIRRKLRKVRDAFAAQLAPDLQVLASALRVGHSFEGALAVVVENAREPSHSELQRVVTDGRLGVPMDEALRRVSDRMANRDLEQVALLAELQRTAGGNSAEVLDTVVRTLRERGELRGLIRTLTAQGRLSRWILTALPVVVGLGAWLLQGELMRPLFSTSSGQIALLVATLMVICGSLIIQKIVDIDV